MCLLTLIPTANKDGKIQQENQLTSSKDGSKDLQIQQFSNIEESKECEYSSTLQYKAKPILKIEMIRNETTSVIYKSEFGYSFYYRQPSAECLENIWKEFGYSFYKRQPSERRSLENIERERNEARKKIERILEEMKEEEKEMKEHIRQMFLMLLFIILIKNINENIKCGHTSCRKYPCLNSILYLLWLSGDVEVNPGPANSTTYRNWLYDTCSVVRKAIAGVSADCKMNKIWKKQPENWPPGELYFDPRNSKGLSVNKVEDFLRILIHCCGDTSKLSHEFISEIDTWNSNRSKDNDQLLYLYRTRECLKSIEQINRSLKVLQSHLLADEVLITEVNTCIRISLSCQPDIDQQFITHTIYRADATRKIASFLGRIVHGKDPEKKCDHIWTIKPDGWPSNLRYYNPNNGGKRCAETDDGMVVETLITLCEQKSMILPKSYQDMVEAWQAGDQTLLSKLMTRHTAETDLKKAVMKLHEEGFLQDSEVDKHLRELGLLVQCNGSQNTKSQFQRDHKEAVDTAVNEFFPGCSFGEYMRSPSQSDSPLIAKIFQNCPLPFDDAFDDKQVE